jgi:hypothetical protein
VCQAPGNLFFAADEEGWRAFRIQANGAPDQLISFPVNGDFTQMEYDPLSGSIFALDENESKIREFNLSSGSSLNSYEVGNITVPALTQGFQLVYNR